MRVRTKVMGVVLAGIAALALYATKDTDVSDRVKGQNCSAISCEVQYPVPDFDEPDPIGPDPPEPEDEYSPNDKPEKDQVQEATERGRQQGMELFGADCNNRPSVDLIGFQSDGTPGFDDKLAELQESIAQLYQDQGSEAAIAFYQGIRDASLGRCTGFDLHGLQGSIDALTEGLPPGLRWNIHTQQLKEFWGDKSYKTLDRVTLKPLMESLAGQSPEQRKANLADFCDNDVAARYFLKPSMEIGSKLPEYQFPCMAMMKQFPQEFEDAVSYSSGDQETPNILTIHHEFVVLDELLEMGPDGKPLISLDEYADERERVYEAAAKVICGAYKADPSHELGKYTNLLVFNVNTLVTNKFGMDRVGYKARDSILHMVQSQCGN